MCRMLCFLISFAIAISLARSWDIAVTTGNQVELFSNKSKTTFESSKFRELTALAYDAVHNMLLFADKQNDNASIFSFNLVTKKYQPLVGRRSNENIQGLAFDPVSNRLFWTDTKEKSIYWISLGPRPTDNIYGKVLLKMEYEVPRDVAIDSCRGYIYWTNINITRATIERARLDGSERMVIVDKDIFMPVSIAVDQRSRKLYWADDREGIHFSIESSNLDGSERQTLLAGTQHKPNSITVSEDSIYWVDLGFEHVWRLPKDATQNTEPEEYLVFNGKPTFGVVANYTIADQTRNVSECENLVKLSQNTTAIAATPILDDLGLFCLHGEKTAPDSCQCSPGYAGRRCEVSMCHNYCLHGACSVLPSGRPICKCPPSFAGERCQVNLCLNYCLHGECEVSAGEPTCLCPEGFTGDRCDTVDAPQTNCSTPLAPITKVMSQTPVTNETPVSSSVTNDAPTLPPVTNDAPTLPQPMSNVRDLSESLDEFVEGCGGWDPVRDPVLMALGAACGLLTLTCAVLVTKVLHLRRRPRIKKRIIVNKNVTPLTARPDQCEITIENCCNMNICETPCFEPRNNIRPTLLDAKPGKEEKRNLIANMESQDDY